MSELKYQSADFIDRLRDAFDEMVLYKDLKRATSFPHSNCHHLCVIG